MANCNGIINYVTDLSRSLGAYPVPIQLYSAVFVEAQTNMNLIAYWSVVNVQSEYVFISSLCLIC